MEESGTVLQKQHSLVSFWIYVPEHHCLRSGLTSLKGSSLLEGSAVFVPLKALVTQIHTYIHLTSVDSRLEQLKQRIQASDLGSSKKGAQTHILVESTISYCSLLTWPRSLFQVPSPTRGIFCPVWSVMKSHVAGIFPQRIKRTNSFAAIL